MLPISKPWRERFSSSVDLAEPVSTCLLFTRALVLMGRYRRLPHGLGCARLRRLLQLHSSLHPVPMLSVHQVRLSARRQADGDNRNSGFDRGPDSWLNEVICATGQLADATGSRVDGSAQVMSPLPDSSWTKTTSRTMSNTNVLRGCQRQL